MSKRLAVLAGHLLADAQKLECQAIGAGVTSGTLRKVDPQQESDVLHDLGGMDIFELLPRDVAQAKTHHDRVEEWLMKNWGRQAYPSKRVCATVEEDIIEKDRLYEYATGMVVPEAIHRTTALAIRRTMAKSMLTKESSSHTFNIQVEDKQRGTQYLEKFVVHHHRTCDGDTAVLLAYFADKRVLKTNWKYLVHAHTELDLSEWLDYKLYSAIQGLSTEISYHPQDEAPKWSGDGRFGISRDVARTKRFQLN